MSIHSPRRIKQRMSFDPTTTTTTMTTTRTTTTTTTTVTPATPWTSMVPLLDVRCREVNIKLRGIHEGVEPKYTSKDLKKFNGEGEYGGITGTISSGFSRIGHALMGLNIGDGVLGPEYIFEPYQSIFLDIGSGTGRPVLSMAGLPLKLCIGFDISRLQVQNSIVNYREMERKGAGVSTPAVFFHHDLFRLKSFDPVTHAYAFVGYEEFVHRIAFIASLSTTLKTLVLVILHKEIQECQLYDPNEDTDVLQLTVAMTGGKSYRAFIIPMTFARKARVLTYFKKLELDNTFPDLSKIIQQCSNKSTCEAIMKQEMAIIDTPRKCRAAAIRTITRKESEDE
jgi:hypothetical protein